MIESARETLLKKAARDAGFDLVEPCDDGWTRIAVSGAPGAAWLWIRGGEISLALETQRLWVEAGNAGGIFQSQRPLPPEAFASVSFSTPDSLFRALNRVRVLLDQSPPRLGDRVRERLSQISVTERTAEVTQRVGQDVFRQALQEYWGGRCAVSGLGLAPLLRASHSKPWAQASDGERLDVHNGFLLAVHLDALFDKGLITFLDDGALLISPKVSREDRDLLGLADGEQRARWIAEGHRPYLGFHRDSIFQR